MFEVYKYDKGFIGIRINRDEIELGERDFFNRLKFIILDERVSDSYIISFQKNISFNQIEIFVSLFNELHKEHQDYSLETIIASLSELFDIFQPKNSELSFIGLLTELVFILNCQERGINIEKYYQTSNDKFDFSLPNDTYLEIKHISEVDRSITISQSQLERLRENDFVIGIRLIKDSVHGLSMNDILNRINLSSIQRAAINNRMNDFDKSYLNRKVITDSCSFRIIEKKYIPCIKEDNRSLIMEASYKLYSLALNKSNDECFDIIKGIING